MVVLGNKSDLSSSRAVDFTQVLAWARQNAGQSMHLSYDAHHCNVVFLHPIAAYFIQCSQCL